MVWSVRPAEGGAGKMVFQWFLSDFGGFGRPGSSWAQQSLGPLPRGLDVRCKVPELFDDIPKKGRMGF